MDTPENAIVFIADAFQINGPKNTDKSYTVRFEIGEYQAENIKKLIGLTDTNYTVVVIPGIHE